MKKLNREWISSQIVEKAQDAIIFADVEGVIRLWNSGAETIFWFSAEEALRKDLDLIIPEQLRERHARGYRKVMETGSTRYGSQVLAVPAQTKAGLRVSIEFTVVLIRSDDGEMLGVGAIIRDVTEGWKREKEIRRRLEQCEENP
jgi:PAS domain S-box-containing protein